MMNRLKLVNFSGIATCFSRDYKCIDSFPPISCDFSFGTANGFISDYGCGSWGLGTCLSGYGQWESFGKVYIDEELVDQETLKKISGTILDPVWHQFCLKNKEDTVRNCIEYALQKSQQPFCHSEIKDIFSLSNSRYNRPIHESSGEIWNISLAILFSLKKDIIVYPWLNAVDIKRVVYAETEGILDFLKKQQKMLFIPSSQRKTIVRICDRSIEFDITLNKANIKYR